MDWRSRVLPTMSSSEAEYYGLLEALELARKLKPGRACFYLDNQAVAGQAAGRFAVRERKLKLLHSRTCAAMAYLREKLGIELEIYFVPREYNLLADALASDALLLPPPAQKMERVAGSEIK
jgi:ribonuclease HI